MGRTDAESLPKIELGILGGTGLYEMEGLDVSEEIHLDTPFGEPSDSYVIGTLEGMKLAFLSRHRRGHRLLPFEINYRANIYGFKMLGVERVLSVSAVGSLREELRPRDIVCADQFFDRTSKRENTFFGRGLAAHVGFAEPVCPELRNMIFQAGRDAGLRIHNGGTYICIEGPSFSTKAESNIYRSWGCEVIGMTGVTEAKLCREAELCYATMSLVTDYDVWHESEETVSVEMIFENLKENILNAKVILRGAVKALAKAGGRSCGCGEALNNCIVTRPYLIPSERKDELKAILGKYI